MGNRTVTKQIGVNLTEGSIVEKMFTYALPLLLANLLQQMYNTVDTIVIGQFVGTTGTVGVSTGGEIATLVTFIATAFGNAGQVYVAQLFGAKSHEKITRAVETLLTTMLVLSVAFTVICLLFCEPLLRLLNCPEEGFAQAKSYMLIASLGLPAIFLYNAVCGVLRGIGESKKPLLFIVISTVANIAMDLLFVIVIPLESAGTAIATIIAQYAACIAAFVCIYRRKEAFGLTFKLSELRIYEEQFKKLMALGIPMASKLALIYASQLYCTAQINLYGMTASATNSIGNKINKLVNVFVSSVDTGAASIVGQSLGAKKVDRAKKTVYVALVFALVINGILCLMSLLVPRQVFRLYTADAEVIEMGVTYMRICIISFILTAIQGPYSAVITGSGNAVLAFVQGVMDSVVLRIGISLILAYCFDMGVWGYFYGNAVARTAPAVIALIYFYSGRWQKRKLLSEK